MAIVINGSGTVTGLAVGGLPDGTVDAGTLATNSVDSAELIDGAVDDSHMASISGRKNMVINGAMKVWQRSTSEAAVAAGYNTADRWYTTITSGGVWTQSKATGTAGFASAIKMDCTTADASLAASDRLMLSYRLEGQDLQHLKKGTASAESVTLSFWVKSPKTGTHIVELYDHDNSRHICQAYTVSSADTWEQKTLTFAGDTTGAFGDDNGKSFELQFYMAAGSDYTSGTLATSWAASSNASRAVGQVNCADSTNNNFYLTGVQLELGSVATDFEHRSYGEELALCMRYYWKLAQDGVMQVGRTISGNRVDASINFPVTMRASPTLNTSTVTHGSVYLDGTTFAPSNPTVSGAHVSLYSIGLRFSCSETVAANHVSSMQISIVELDSEL